MYIFFKKEYSFGLFVALAGFHLSGTVTAPKSSSGSPLPPSSSSGAVGGGGAAAGGTAGPGGGGNNVVTAGTTGPPVETEKKYRVSVSFDRYAFNLVFLVRVIESNSLLVVGIFI